MHIDRSIFRFPTIRQHSSEQLFARFAALSDNQVQSLLGLKTHPSISGALDTLLDTQWALIEENDLREEIDKVYAGFGL